MVSKVIVKVLKSIKPKFDVLSQYNIKKGGFDMNNTYKMINLLKTLSEKQKQEFYKFLISLNCPDEKQETLNIQELSSASHHQDC